jgi:hypothetical protein
MRGLTEETVANTVRDFFIVSHDFNGISTLELTRQLAAGWDDVKPILARLIERGQIEAVFYSHQDNPHIKRLPLLSVADQLARLTKDELQEVVCLYPTREVIAESGNVGAFDNRPFTKRLFLAEPQLIPVFFDLDVLDPYFRDPRYLCDFHDFSGRISIQDEHYQSEDMRERDKVFLQSFGIGYGPDRTRVVVAYLRYLADLSPEHQQIWKAREITQPCTLNSDYAGAALYGHWPQHRSVYQAFVQEQVELNKLASLIGKPSLFLRTFDSERPSGFHPMLRPTQRNFDEFILLLDKMLSDNLNRKFFRGDIELEELIENEAGVTERRSLGTLKLLENWLRTRYRTYNGEDVSKEVLEPLYEVRRLRQPLAHTLREDRYDKTFPKQQDDLLGRVIRALTKLRLILWSHPRARGQYKPPDWLDGDKIVFY